MDTDLMRSPGIQPAANPCEIREVLLYKHIGSGTLAMLGYAHLSRIVSISGDSPGDGAVLLCNVSPGKCLILPIDLLVFQHGIKQWLQKGNFAEYHGSAGFVIQAVKRANTGIVSLQKIMCLDQITDGVCMFDTVTVYQKIRRLIHDAKEFILKQYLQILVSGLYRIFLHRKKDAYGILLL